MLGDTQISCTLTPQKVNGLPQPAFDIQAGGNGTCARLTDGSVSCWGSLVHPWMGVPHVEELATPVTIQW